MNNKLRIIATLMVTLPLILVTGCDDEFPDYYHEKEFVVESFEGVKLGEAFQIEIIRAEEFSVIAKGEDRDLNDLRLEVVNGILIGHYRPGSRNHKRTFIQTSMPVLKSAQLYDTSSTKITGYHHCTDRLKIQVSGTPKVVTDSDRRYWELQIEYSSKFVFKWQEKDLPSSVKKPSRLLGRVNIGEYGYNWSRWI